MIRRRDALDEYSWWCRQCKGCKSIRTGSFFSKSKVNSYISSPITPRAACNHNVKISLRKWMLLMFYWTREYPVTSAQWEAEVSLKTAIDAYQWFREVCTTDLLQTPIILGGPGVVVQIDESLFRHKPKVRNCI